MKVVFRVVNGREKSPSVSYWTLLVFVLSIHFAGFSSSVVSAQGLPYQTFPFPELRLGAEVKTSGKALMARDPGWVRIIQTPVRGDSILYVALHGYASEGYEWIYPLKRLAQTGFPTYFYRYDWTLCPDTLVVVIQKDIQLLMDWSPMVKKLVLVAHSYGGLLAVSLASEEPIPVPEFEVHVVAAPLAGHPSIVDRCGEHGPAFFDSTLVLLPRVTLHQWRTIKEQDGAYRQLAVDPQVVNIPGSAVTVLPPLLDGHRLGHNWSLTWVIDTYLGQE